MARKHSHYFKDVSALNDADVYRFCDLFKVDDPSGATQHAIKKLLLPGQRGAGKSRRDDLQEAVDTLVRRIEMYDEDAKIASLRPRVTPGTTPDPLHPERILSHMQPPDARRDEELLVLGMGLSSWPRVVALCAHKTDHWLSIPLQDMLDIYSRTRVGDIGVCNRQQWTAFRHKLRDNAAYAHTPNHKVWDDAFARIAKTLPV